MHAMASRAFDRNAEIIAFPDDLAGRPPLPPRMPNSFDVPRGPNWLAIGAIGALHVAALGALITLDVVQFEARKPEVTVVTLTPEPIALPPPAPPPPSDTPRADKPIQTRIVSPPPIVAIPPSPQQIASVPTPPPPVPTAAVPAESATPAPPAAPVSPPDASAASLGNAPPRYPLDARRKRQEGSVRLRVVITPDGRVKDISVARSSGVESLDEAALSTVRRWKFKPGMQSGIPVEAVGYLNIPFTLK